MNLIEIRKTNGELTLSTLERKRSQKEVERIEEEFLVNYPKNDAQLHFERYGFRQVP